MRYLRRWEIDGFGGSEDSFEGESGGDEARRAEKLENSRELGEVIKGGEGVIRIRDVSGRRGELFKRGVSDLKTEKRGSRRRTMKCVCSSAQLKKLDSEVVQKGNH
jgi:hypothetical protein